MTKYFSPHTGEAIHTDNPADWMGRSDKESPDYNLQTQGCFWRGAEWEIVVASTQTALILPSISPRQIRQALTRAGLRESVESVVASGDQDLKDWYEFATEFDRYNQRVVDMGVILGKTPEQLDSLWILGNSL